MAQPSGPFGAVVFGSIDGHAVRLDFFIEAGTGSCAVHLFDLAGKNVLVELVTASTFEESIEAYPWNPALDTLDLI